MKNTAYPTIFSQDVLKKRDHRIVEAITTTIRELHGRVVEFYEQTTDGRIEPLNPRPNWQRDYIFKPDRYVSFITAIWERNPINPILIARMPGEAVDSIFDGLQRYGMIEQYLKSEEFRYLPKHIQNEFYKTKISIINLGNNWFDSEKEAANYFIALNKGTTVLSTEQMRRMVYRNDACYKFLVKDINLRPEWKNFFSKMVRENPEDLSNMSDEKALFTYLGCFVHSTPANTQTSKGWFDAVSCDPDWKEVLEDFYKHLTLLIRVYTEVMGNKVSKGKINKYFRVMFACAKAAPSNLLFQEQAKVFCRLNGKKVDPSEYLKTYNLDVEIIKSLYGAAGEYAIVKSIRTAMESSKRTVKWRDKLPFSGVCSVTGMSIEKMDAEVDHIVPLSKGGLDVSDNVQWVGKYVNRVKGNRSETTKSI